LPPDNAQNWYRHQLAELGVLGSFGWILWMGALATLVWRTLVRRIAMTEWLVPVSLLVGVAVSALVAMPGQDVAVAVVIWTLVGWLLSMAPAVHPQTPPRLLRGTVWLIVLAFVAGTAMRARSDLRVPFRAARFNFDYTYGFDFTEHERILTSEHAVTVPVATDRWLKLTYWVEHPDADEQRVQVDIWRDRERVVSRRLSRGVPVTEFVAVPEGKRFVLEVKIDRTFRDEKSGVERGLAMRWDFVPNRP
jgi:hypothetical protein